MMKQTPAVKISQPPESDGLLEMLMSSRKKDLDFANSPVFDRMINSVLTVGKPISNRDIIQDMNNVREAFDWQDLSDEQINLFINVMSDSSQAPVVAKGFLKNESDNILFSRFGLNVIRIYQRNIIWIGPSILYPNQVEALSKELASANRPALLAALADIDWDKVSNSHADKKKASEVFFTSEVCTRIIRDIEQGDRRIDDHDFFYNREEIISAFGWEDISSETLNNFWDVITDWSIGVEASMFDYDDSNPFPHSAYLKGGLHVCSMSGQGTVFWIQPIGLDPQIDLKFKALV